MSDAVTPTGNTYDKYGTTNPIEQRMMAGFMSALDRMLDRATADRTPRRILEVGVGEGVVTQRLTERFPEVPVVGIDLPDPELARRWGPGRWSCSFADATRLPFADATFDLVLAIEVLEHVPVPDRALREIQRVCRRDLVASVPFEPIWRVGNVARGRYVRDLGNTPGHVNHWTRRSFRRFVDGRFDVVDVASPLPWTMVRARRH
jgi:ubiquinone/menaquinone biosynthesis C-methylase UbiE